MYRIFQRAAGAAPVGAIVIALVAATAIAVAIGVVRVTRQHEVLQLGYQLSREADHVRELREVHRRLELELATLAAPERIRRLASELGMAAVSPDRIRVVDAGHHPKVAAQP